MYQTVSLDWADKCSGQTE